jgi:hypothetical protein
MAFSNDFTTWDASPSGNDRKVKFMMQELQVKDTIGRCKVAQTHFPGFWNLRVLSKLAASNVLVLDQEVEDDFLRFFDGMQVGDSAPKNGNGMSK